MDIWSLHTWILSFKKPLPFRRGGMVRLFVGQQLVVLWPVSSHVLFSLLRLLVPSLPPPHPHISVSGCFDRQNRKTLAVCGCLQSHISSHPGQTGPGLCSASIQFSWCPAVLRWLPSFLGGSWILLILRCASFLHILLSLTSDFVVHSVVWL